MAEINNIDYSSWKNTALQKFAQEADKDGIKGLNKAEVIDFIEIAANNHVEKAEIYETLGLSIPKSSPSGRSSRAQNPEFTKAANYYNNTMTSYERTDVTTQTYNNLETRLYQMERAIDDAFIDCDAYKDIVIVPRWHYRYYPNFNDKLINFDIEEIRNTTSKDMNSLHELKDKIEYIIEEANGETKHTTPDKTEYDVDTLAQKHLGMSYSEFVSKYKDELEFCKTVTAADLYAMNDTQRMVYSKAKAYAAEMLQTTINEAHTTNWDAGERKLDETLNATDEMLAISDFETDGITNEGVENLKSGIMYKAFEEALINKYHELNASGIQNTESDDKSLKPRKQVVNGVVLIFNADGTVYDTSGKRVK